MLVLCKSLLRTFVAGRESEQVPPGLGLGECYYAQWAPFQVLALLSLYLYLNLDLNTARWCSVVAAQCNWWCHSAHTSSN